MKLATVRRGSRTETTLERCPSCGSEHLSPVPCGLIFAQRIKGLRFGTDWMPAKADTRQREGTYYDRSALDEAFGTDRKEQMLHETRGLGPVRTAADGSEWVYDDPSTGEMRPLESSDISGGYLRGTPEGELAEGS